MATQKTITINGRAYDAVTGLPVDTPKPAATKPASTTVKPAAPVAKAKPASTASRSQASSVAVHGTVQKSKTLMHRAAKKPAAPQKVVRRTQPGKHMDFARSTNVTKFAAHPVVKEAKTASASPVHAPAKTATRQPQKPLVADKPARAHPAAQRALAKAHAKKVAATPKPAQPVTTKQVKDEAIAKALAKPKTKHKKSRKNVWGRRILVIGVSIAVLGLALFAVYKFVPSVSVSIAAAQAGIEARFPDYTPDGYALNQPVTYTDGEVNLKFKSNSNNSSYSINQKRSSWDSSAVLDNVVVPAVGQSYTTTKERGLTIYTYEKGAAWVNGGLLYTISGDAALSSDQVRRLATSL